MKRVRRQCRGVLPVDTAAGFTLIEILVVIFIVSIMTGIAVANMPTFVRSGEFDTETRRLLTLVRMVREEAVLQASEYGFRAYTDGYEFMIYDDAGQSWIAVEEQPFQPRSLPEGMELDLIVEDTSLSVMPADDEEGGNDRDEVPPVLILSSGETTPFELVISMPERDLVKSLGTDGYNTIEWTSDNETQ